MRIVTLMENTSCREDLTAEHGLSLYIETGEYRILFDAGQTGAFADNAEKLGIDLSKVDLAVLSHGHYDHGGGLRRFLEINKTAPVWMNPHAFGEHYNGSEEYIGLDPALAKSGRIRYAENERTIGPGMTLFTRISCPEPIRPFGLRVREGEGLVPEVFRHEQYLLVEEDGRKLCFSGCSHRGILNIMEHFRPDVLIGGFHFMKLDPAGAELEAAAARLRRYPCIYYTGHCTGREQYETLKDRLGSRLHSLSSGKEIRLMGENS